MARKPTWPHISLSLYVPSKILLQNAISSCSRNKIYCLATNYRRVPIIATGNKTFIFQLWPHILKAFHCVSVLFTVEMVLPHLLDFGCTFGQVMSI